jgi:ribosomal protein S18 acetylase RimI-like enzyme
MNSTPLPARPRVLRCARCGRFVDWLEARLQVVCSCRPHIELLPVLTRELTDVDRPAALDLFEGEFGHVHVISFGEVIALAEMDMVIAGAPGEVGGALAWRRRDDALQIVALATDPMWQRSGVGGHLLVEAEMLARSQQLGRVIVSMSNDNLPALYFYQRHGYRVIEVALDAITQHPEGHGPGFGQIHARDEFRLEKRLAA